MRRDCALTGLSVQTMYKIPGILLKDDMTIHEIGKGLERMKPGNRGGIQYLEQAEHHHLSRYNVRG
jgi:hypothetical protein